MNEIVLIERCFLDLFEKGFLFAHVLALRKRFFVLLLLLTKGSKYVILICGV